MSDDRVTVAVTNFNGEAYLPWCLEAVKRLEPAPAEIIVVDNGSDDGSVALLEEQYPEVRRIVLPANEGPCPARNAGLKAAAHPLVFQIDCDVAPRPGCLALLLAAMKTGGEAVVACQPRAVFFDRPDRIHYDGAWFHYLGLMNLIHFYASLPPPPESVREVDGVIAAALLLRRDRVLEVGGYDPSYFILFEDHDLSFRLRAQGNKLLAVPGAVVDHKEGTEGISFRKASYPRRRAFLHSRNRWILLFKNHRLRTLFLTAPGLLLFEAVWILFSIRQGFPLAYIKGKLSFLRMIPRLWGERRKVQRSRVIDDRELLGARDLTFSPVIRKSGFERLVELAVNRALRVWWYLVSPLVR